MAKKVQQIKKSFLSTYKVHLLIISALIVVLYGRALKYDYVGLDDKLLILDNFKFINDFGNIKKAFVNDVFYNPDIPGGARAYYRPLLTVSLMIDSHFGKQLPMFYHFTNILLHLISCILLFKFFKLLKMSDELTFTGTLLFAVHPMLSQAIGWIPGRNDSMITVFILAGLIYFVQFLETNNKSKLWKHVLFFALAIFTKETAVFLPLICVLYYFLIHQPQKNVTSQSDKNILPLLVAYAVVSLPWFLLRKHVIAQTAADLSISHLSESFFENLPIYFQVVQKIIAPYNLSIMSIAKDTNYLISMVLMAVVILLLIFSKQVRWKYVLFGFVWFNVFLLPAFVVPILTGFEHRAYLPLIGFLLMIFEIDYFKTISFNKPKSYIPIALILLLFMVINFQHLPAFSNKFLFWEKAASNSPHSSLAKLNYGAALADRGRTEEAIKVYRDGLEINYKEPMIHNNLGAIYAQRNQYIEAEKEFKEENKVNPTYSDAFYNLGVVYEKQGKEKEMIEAWEKALSIHSYHPMAKKALEKYYRKKGKLNIQ